MADELGRCPFEHVDKEMGHNTYIEGDGLYRVHCTCGATGPLMATKETAAQAWNQRPAENKGGVKIKALDDIKRGEMVRLCTGSEGFKVVPCNKEPTGISCEYSNMPANPCLFFLCKYHEKNHGIEW